MKLPVVASDIGGLPEVVKEGKTGFLFPPGDVGGLRAKLLKLTEDSGLRTSIGEAAHKQVQRYHRIEEMATTYADFLLG